MTIYKEDKKKTSQAPILEIKMCCFQYLNAPEKVSGC
jgi:hypothetical protein